VSDVEPLPEIFDSYGDVGHRPNEAPPQTDEACRGREAEERG